MARDFGFLNIAITCILSVNWIGMPECTVCGGGEFDLSDGLFFCSECGTQSQVSA